MTKKYLIITAILVLGIIGGGTYLNSPAGKKITQRFHSNAASPTPVPDKYLSFTYEVFDTIKQNFWDKISDEDLAKIYALATEKITSAPPALTPKTKDELGNLVGQTIKDYPDDKKKEFVTKIADMVLANLKPFGRSRLYTAKEEKKLHDNVLNVDTATDLYAVLGLTKSASANDVKTNYEKKKAELKDDKTDAGIQKLAAIERAFAALSVPEKKQQYDTTGVEPTVTSKLITPDIFYIKFSRFSPQSFDEFKKAADSIDPNKKGGPTALIFDLRGNIGGSIDILQYFLGPFIGPNNYAYEFYHQGDTTPFKTKYGWFDSLVRYKKVVILIDSQCQSSSEVMAATLKKYNVGVLVGSTTKGWGTVEQNMPLQNQFDNTEKYSVFLVHSVTLRDDGQPIESRGVDPTINVKDKDWPQQLLAYFNYQPLVDAVKGLVK